MRVQSTDTNPVIEEILISNIRQKSIPERLSQLGSITSLTLRLSKRALARANPHLNKKVPDLLFIKYHYGESLANRLNEYLEKIDYEKNGC